MRPPRRRALALFACAGLGSGDAVLASGPAVSGVTAVADSAIDGASNPAGLTRIQHTEWDGEAIGIQAESTDDISTSGGRSQRVDNSSTLGIPAVYYAQPWSDRLGLGVSLSVPAGIGSNPGDDTIGRYLLEKWSLGCASLAPAVGYRVTDQLSLGLALNLNYAAYEYKAAVFNGPGQPDGEMKLSGSDFGVGFRVGALYELAPGTRFGLVYQNSTTSSFSDTPEFSGLSEARQAVLNRAGVLTRPVSLESRFPQAVIAGLYHEFPNRMSVTLDAAWVNFSQFGLTSATLGNTTLSTDNGRYQDMWAGTAGLRWPVNDRWSAQFGLAYVSSGVSDANRDFTLRLDRIWGAGAGATYHWKENQELAVDLTYYDLGDAPVSLGVPLVGSLSASYSTNYAIALKISYRWVRL